MINFLVRSFSLLLLRRCALSNSAILLVHYRPEQARKFSKVALIGVLLGVLGCKEGKKNEAASIVPIQTTNLTILEYDAISVQLSLQGTLAIGGIADLDIMEVYTNKDCSGARAGTTLVRSFEASGIEINVPSTESVELYVTTVNSSSCLYFSEFSPTDLKPSVPTFKSISPVSPSKVTFQPGIYGEAYPNSADVSFFSDNTCSIAVGNGSVTNYESIGLQVTLTPNTLSSVYGQTEDPLGQLSECVSLTEFRHANLILPSPTFSAAIPTSPNNTTNQPLIQGVADSTTELVEIYSDAGCTVTLSTGSLTDFASGIAVSLTSNVTNGVYAKIRDDLDNESSCTFLTTYVHDTIGPTDPTFSSVSPTSPTNSTTSPFLIGTAPVDSLTTRFFNSSLCLTQLGLGSSSAFTSGGLAANIPANQTTGIYAKNYDAAGNGSSCVYMMDYKHNTIPPSAPTFLGTTPLSPSNGTTNPLVYGTASVFTVSLNFYSDEFCANFSGSGSQTVFESPGLTATLSANTNNTIYTRVYDIEGNESDCNFLGTYDHSNSPAPAPGFLFSFPTSPNRTSTNPFIVGTADSVISSLEIFDDNTCANSLGSGSRPAFVASGIQISVPANSTTDLHAISTDVYGNISVCTYLAQYIHNTVPPLDPTFLSIAPATPNNLSYSPTISGAALANPGSQLSPNEVEFYDSGVCVNKLGEDTPANFAGSGVGINTYRNAVTNVYARSFDAAGNASNCTLMVNYTHDDLQPAQPMFLSVNPTAPSFVSQTVLTGFYGTSTDFLNRVSLGIYSDSSCSVQLVTAAPSDLNTVGVTVTLPENATTSLYGNSTNEVGTLSNCNFLTTFQHYDLPPANIAANSNFDGSVAVSWLPDPVSTAVLTYTLERSADPAGPYTVLTNSLISNVYTDLAISEGQDYYYRVYTNNTTGRSEYSSIVGITIASPPPQQALSLVAYPGPSEVYLSWSGFPQNMSYKIFRSTQKGGPFQALAASPTVTSYEDTPLTPDTTYYYYVVGTNAAGDSMQSNVAEVYPKANPSAPTEFTIQPVLKSSNCGGASAVHMSWAAPEYFETFQVRRGTGAIGTTSSLQYVACSGALANEENLRVRATWGNGFSANSTVIWFRDTGGPALNAYPGNGELLLQWTQNDGGTWYGTWTPRYEIFRSTNRNGPYTLLQTNLTGLSFTDSSVVNGTSYFYYIQAYVIDGGAERRWVGYPSLVQSGTPTPNPSAPSNLSLVYDDLFGIKLDWQMDDHANYYRVYTSNSSGGPFVQATTTSQNFLYGAPASEGTNYYRVSAVWGNYETPVTNTVFHRRATISGLSAISGASDIQLNWLDVPGVQDYEILRSTLIGGTYSSVAMVGSSDYTDNTVSVGQGHYYKIKARFADASEGELSSSVRGMRTGSPFPSGVSTSNVTGSTFTVNWAPVPGATKYEIHVSTIVGGPYVKKNEHPSLTTQTASGLVANTKYFVFVRALVGGTNFDSSPPSTETTFSTPSAPLVTVRNNELNLSWTPSVGATSYDLLRSTDAVNFSSVVTGHPTSSYLDTTVTNGTMYFYKLVVNYPAGSVSSIATTGSISGQTPYAPGSLSVRTDGSGTGVLLSWGQVDGATTYSVYRATSPGGPFVTPVLTTASFDNVLDAGLTTGIAYYYQVRARIGDLTSGASNTVGFIPVLNHIAPTVEQENVGAVTISWGAVAGASSYDVYRSETTADFNLLASGVAATGYEDSTINAAKTYFYYFIPKSAAGAFYAQSNISQGVNVTTAPLAPQGIHAILPSLTSVQLDWITTPNALTYNVYRSVTSGGPYTLVNSVTAPTVNYLDSTVSGGNSYFYMIRSVNSSSVESIDSQEVGVRTVTGPTGLVGVNVPAGVSLSWSGTGGASLYNIYRSDWSGGPYGFIGTTATLSFVDTTTSPQKTYYYVVDAEFASVAKSQISSEISVLRGGSVDLVVPVEMIDQPVGSVNSESRVFERSRTYIDTNFYDGAISTNWEVIATNVEGVPREVRIRDGSNALVASITIPANTTSATRLTQSFTLAVGNENYRLELEQTTTDLQTSILNSQIQIVQVGATKTRLYFPLLSSDGNISSGDESVASLITTLSSFQSLDEAIVFKREANQLDRILDYNAWEIEAYVSASGGSIGAIQFYNKSSLTSLPMTETNFSTSSIQRARIFIDEGSTQFGSANEEHNYELQIKCEFNCDLGSPRVHKAGLWVTLENLTKATVAFRNLPAVIETPADTQLADHRSRINTSQFSNNQIYFMVDGEDSISSNGNVELRHHGADSGSAGLSTVAGSSLNFSLNTRQVLKSGALTLSSGDRFLTRVNPSSGTLKVRSSWILIYVDSP